MKGTVSLSRWICSSELLRRSAACYPIYGGRHLLSRSTGKDAMISLQLTSKGEARGDDVDMETEGRMEGLTSNNGCGMTRSARGKCPRP
jgi:hypothetical protein